MEKHLAVALGIFIVAFAVGFPLMIILPLAFNDCKDSHFKHIAFLTHELLQGIRDVEALDSMRKLDLRPTTD